MKITVNNEEVVCSNELTITEEMLTTSSTILNNCYPKSWEQEHDYISRFYYPKDYSKCKISDPKFIPGVIGITTEGTDITINYDEDKNWQLKQLKGNTYQQTYSGKNLLPNNTTNKTINGITFIRNSDGSITANGTATNTIFFNCGDTTLPAGKYNLSSTTTCLLNAYLQLIEVVTGSPVITNLSKVSNKSFTINNEKNIRVYFRISSGTTLSNMTIYPMIEEGTTMTSYEPYVGGTPSPNPDYPQEIQNVTGRQVVSINEQQFEINLGKNLFDINSTPNWIGGGTTYSVNNDILTIQGNWYVGFLINIQENTDYYLSALKNIIVSQTGTGNMAIYDKNKQFIKNINNGGIFNSGSNNQIYLVLYSGNGNSGTVEFSNIQLEKGATATTYSPYFTPIELNKIGDYQDYIDGDVDNWYVNSYTDKVVLDGNENYKLNNNYTNNSRFTCNDIFLNKSVRDVYCNYFTKGTGGTDTTNIDINGSTGKIMLTIPNNIATTISNLTTWLSTHNTEVLYVLNEPTRTKITNTELVEQLNNLAQANLLNGYNNIIVSSENLPASLNIYYNFIDDKYEENLMFCGVVKNTGNMSLNPRDPHYASLQVLDFKTMLSEGDTLGFVISEKTVPQAIQMVVDAISTYGVVVGNIDILNPDEVIGAYSTVDKTAYDVLQYLAEISQSRWTTRLIDENTIAIDFYDPTLMPQADDIEYTKEYFEENNIINIEYSYGTYDYRNKQIMTSDQVYGSIDYVETILADGYNRTFNTTTNIGYIKSIFVNGVSKTFATKDEKEIGIESDFYYTPGQMQIESNENETIISSNTPIVITYIPLVKGRQIIYNNDEVERISSQTNRNGVISRYENRNDTLLIDELNQIGQTYIKYKGSAEINLVVSTFNYDLFNVGQLVYFNAPLDELKKQYMVKQKEITMYTAKSQQNIFVKYTLTSSFNSEREVNYFDNQRNKAKGNISAGEYITRNVDIENTANIIFNNLTIEEVEEGNVLNSILNSPLNN